MESGYSLDHGSGGVIASGGSVAMLREWVGGIPIIVCPWIRPRGADRHDQKRVAAPAAAIKNGADYLVVGRPIRDAPDPRAMAESITEEINNALRYSVRDLAQSNASFSLPFAVA